MKSFGIASFSFLQLLLLSKGCTAENNETNEKFDPLARLLLDQFTSASKKPGFLRKLAEDTAFRREFGPGADWSCSAESNRGTDFDSCTLSAASKASKGGCSWCPLGSETGICLRAGQASVVNGLETESLLHLRCYSDSDEVIGEEATAFWDEVEACLPHHKEDCGDDHNGHACTYCTTKEPNMGICLSNTLWENLVIAQAVEDFEGGLTMDAQINLDQVIHCSKEVGKSETGSGDNKYDDNLWDNPCDIPPITDEASEAECTKKEGCAVAPNIFPGFLGSKPGRLCVSTAKKQAIVWAAGVLKDMGWTKEMDAYDVL